MTRNPFRSPLRLITLIGLAIIPAVLLVCALKANGSPLWQTPVTYAPPVHVVPGYDVACENVCPLPHNPKEK